MAIKVSTVITAHNDVATLSKAIDSVLEQTRKADEIIVVDDGSKDATSEVVKVYDEVALLRQKEMGSFSARNNGVMMAEMPWIAFLDAKDSWSQEKLQEQSAFHKKNPACKASVYTGKGVMTVPVALTTGRINTSDVMIEKKLFEQLGGFDEAFGVDEDDEFWMRVAEAV